MIETSFAASFSDVRDAAERLRGVTHRTPVVTSSTLDARTGARIFCKAENLQRIGAFKIRGAYNAIVQLAPDRKRGGVVAFSSGNHAQGVALAARLLGVPATIVMPERLMPGRSARIWAEPMSTASFSGCECIWR